MKDPEMAWSEMFKTLRGDIEEVKILRRENSGSGSGR